MIFRIKKFGMQLEGLKTQDIKQFSYIAIVRSNY